MNNYTLRTVLLVNKKAELESELSQIPYDGTVEIKTIADKQYLYIRKKVDNRTTSTYVGLYTLENYNALHRSSLRAKEIKKELREINKELNKAGYEELELPIKVASSVKLAKHRLNRIIYSQALLEGMSLNYENVKPIIENDVVKDMKPTDILKIMNLKNAWNFILEKDIIMSKIDLHLISSIARIVNEGFYHELGILRTIPVAIGGCKYTPPIPNEQMASKDVAKIFRRRKSDLDKAIDICLYLIKNQLFNDGNKRTAIIVANQYLIQKGRGLLIIPDKKVEQFRKLLVEYFDSNNRTKINSFLKKCQLKPK